jgi:hypothetical protein
MALPEADEGVVNSCLTMDPHMQTGTDRISPHRKDGLACMREMSVVLHYFMSTCATCGDDALGNSDMRLGVVENSKVAPWCLDGLDPNSTVVLCYPPSSMFILTW